MVQIIEWLGALALVLAIAQGLITCTAVWRKRDREAMLLNERSLYLQKNAHLAFQKAQQEIERQQHVWQDWRKFEVERIVQEAEGIRSFYLKPHDKKVIPAFYPGQFLTFKLSLPSGQSLTRCYSLSEAPEVKEHYRVTIKHIQATETHLAGLASSYFHEQLKEGDILNVKPPSGQFYLQQNSQRPVVLIGGGIGVTPVLSMLNSICAMESERETWFFYGVRNGDEQIAVQALRQKEQQHKNLRIIICYSAPRAKEVEGQDYTVQGRISVPLLQRFLPSNNYEFYICGPDAMMASLTEQLAQWQVPEEDIFFEAFGPSSVRKTVSNAGDEKTFQVTFAKSGVSTLWSSDRGSLLELAEAEGLSPDAGCRAGNCGTCLVAVKEGEVDYLASAGSQPEQGSCLLCVCKPKGDIVLDA